MVYFYPKYALVELDPIEIRIGNYFACKGAVKEITEDDLINLKSLLPALQPIPITILRLNKLNFCQERGEHGLVYQKLSNKVLFTFIKLKGDRLQLVINNSLKIPHIQFIHQLQNVYYDLSGDVLKRPEHKINTQEFSTPGTPVTFPKTNALSGKYRRKE